MRVSVVIPIFNEERYIRDCVDSLLHQTFSKMDMEWIFVDGGSTDLSKEILYEYRETWPKLIKIYSMNIGIGESEGDYIVRLDAHAEYPPDYIEKCVYYLDMTDADNVGGLANTKGQSASGKVISKMLSSKFGVGNSQFRTQGKSGYVDTVPFGAFKKSVFERLGGYDERLTRNQDNEMNERIRKNGGKIYLSDDIHFSYYARDSVKGILKMALQNGKWNVITSYLCPGTMGIRHFVPMVFVLSIAFFSIAGISAKIWRFFLCIELGVYVLLDLIFSFRAGEKWRERFSLIFLFPAFHITYGIGSLVGLIVGMKKEYRKSKRGKYNDIIWKNKK